MLKHISAAALLSCLFSLVPGCSPSPTAGLGPAVWSPPQAGEVRALVERGLRNMARIERMDSMKVYTLPVADGTWTGRAGTFLRRRTGEQVIESRLSTGCGDNALAFCRMMRSRGVKALVIDGVEMSIASLWHENSGHVVSAVWDEHDDKWILADPSRQKVLAADWLIDSPTFTSGPRRYYVGLRCPPEEYPLEGPPGAKRFYRRTLDAVPKATWRDYLIGIRFVVDDSMRTEDGGALNPRVPEFVEATADALATRDIEPDRWVSVRIVPARGTAISHVRHTDKGWTLVAGTGSAMGPSLLRHVEAVLRKRGVR